MDSAIPEQALRSVNQRRLACVFVIVFGVTKLAELIDWSRLHGDVVTMLGFSSGTVTGLLIAGKAVELGLTVLAVLALTRRRLLWLFSALAGWTVDLAVLTVVAAIYGDVGRIIEHGLCFLVFTALTYVFGGRALMRRQGPAKPAISLPEIPAALALPSGPPVPTGARETRRDLPTEDAGATRQDLPTRAPDVNRQELQARGSDQTRQDLPVRRPKS